MKKKTKSLKKQNKLRLEIDRRSRVIRNSNKPIKNIQKSYSIELVELIRSMLNSNRYILKSVFGNDEPPIFLNIIIDKEERENIIHCRVAEIQNDSVTILVNYYQNFSVKDYKKIKSLDIKLHDTDVRSEFELLLDKIFLYKKDLYTVINEKIYMNDIVTVFNSRKYGETKSKNFLGIAIAAFLFQNRLRTISNIVEKTIDPFQKIIFKNNARIGFKYLHPKNSEEFTKGLIFNPFSAEFENPWSSFLLTFKFDIAKK